jgi:hypothetical protein
MGFFPFNKARARTAQTDVKGIETSLYSVVKYSAGSPGAADDDYYVASVNMKVGAYTLAHTAPVGGGARNVTVTHTAVDAADTLGTITVTGTDLSGAVITETITPTSGGVKQGTKAFATITSIVGAGWVIGGGNDTIKVGFGDLIGLPDKLIGDTVLFCTLAGVREAAAAVTFSSTVLSANTVDLTSALNAGAVTIYYIV